MRPKFATRSLVCAFVLLQGLVSSNFAGSPTSAPPNASVKYYGGRVVSNVQVCVVFWSSAVNAITQANIATFYSDFVNVFPNGYSFLATLSEYSTPGGTNQFIGPGSAVGPFTITPGISSSTLHDSDIQSELTAQILAGRLPAPTMDRQGYPNTVYMIYFPAGDTIFDGQGSQSCRDFCAYHSTFTFEGQSIAYGVFPDFGTGSGCATGCGTAGTALQVLTSNSSRILVDTVTDPDVGLATGLAAPLGWYDPNNGEVCDVCNQHADTFTSADGLRTWMINQFFLNSDGLVDYRHACVSYQEPEPFVPGLATPFSLQSGDAEITFVPILLEVYQLQRNSFLNPTQWTNVDGAVTGSIPSNQGIAAVTTLSDAGALNAFSHEFYRLSISLSPSQMPSSSAAVTAPLKKITPSNKRRNGVAKKILAAD